MSSRILNKFTIYPDESTPYPELDFSDDVRNYCDAELNAKPSSANASPHNRLRVAKCVVVGDISVGKTSLIQRFGYNAYGNDYKATIGVDFDVQKFEILHRPFSLQIWDTAGEDRFRVITRSYYRGAHVALIVFDLSNMRSFLNVRSWLKEICGDDHEAAQSRERPIILLVGSKKDLLTCERLEFFESEARKLSAEIGAEFWMISSQTGDSVVDLFNRVACLTFESMIADEIRLTREQELFSRSLANSNQSACCTAELKLRKQTSSSKGDAIHFINRNSGMVCLPPFLKSSGDARKSPKNKIFCRQALVRQRDNLQTCCARLRLALANLCTKMSKSSNGSSVAPSSDQMRKQSILANGERTPKKAKTFQFFRLKCIVAVD